MNDHAKGKHEGQHGKPNYDYNTPPENGPCGEYPYPPFPPVEPCVDNPPPLPVDPCGGYPLPPAEPCVENPPPPPYNPCGEYPPPYNPCVPCNPYCESPLPSGYGEPEECSCHSDPEGIAPFHGFVTFPQSRAYFARLNGWISHHQATEMEGPKNFPRFNNGTGSQDLIWFPGEAGPFPDATAVASPIPTQLPDGLILSGGRSDARIVVNFSDSELNLQHGRVWPKTPVLPGQALQIRWNTTVYHRTRGYRYFITRNGWNQNRRPTRADFEEMPFASRFHTNRYFWNESLQSMGPMNTQSIVLPSTHRTGHHIVLGVWLVADSGAGFYAAVDVNFGGTGGGGGGGGGGGPIDPPPPPPPPGSYPQWQLGTRYELGDRVTYQGINYQCIQRHTAVAPDWTPPRQPALWRRI